MSQGKGGGGGGEVLPSSGLLGVCHLIEVEFLGDLKTRWVWLVEFKPPRFVNCQWNKGVLAQLTYSICIQLSLLGIGSNLSHCLCGLKDVHGFHKMIRSIQSIQWTLMIFYSKLKRWIAQKLMTWPRPIHGPSSPWLSQERTLCWQLHWCSQTESNKAPGSSLPS